MKEYDGKISFLIFFLNDYASFGWVLAKITVEMECRSFRVDIEIGTMPL